MLAERLIFTGGVFFVAALVFLVAGDTRESRALVAIGSGLGLAAFGCVLAGIWLA